MALNTGMACSDRTFDRVSTLRISWSELAWLSHLFLLRSWLPASLLSPVLPTSQSLSEGCVAPAPAGWSACPLRNGGQSPCQKLLRDTSQGTQGLKASPVQWCPPLANAGPPEVGVGACFQRQLLRVVSAGECTPYQGHCGHCGSRSPLPLPQFLDVTLSSLSAFLSFRAPGSSSPACRASSPFSSRSPWWSQLWLWVPRAWGSQQVLAPSLRYWGLLGYVLGSGPWFPHL